MNLGDVFWLTLYYLTNQASLQHPAESLAFENFLQPLTWWSLGTGGQKKRKLVRETQGGVGVVELVGL